MCVICLPCHVSVPIFSCYIQLTLLPRHPPCNGLRQIFGDTPWVRPTPTGSKSWINTWFGGQIMNFSILKWFQTFFLIRAKFKGDISPIPPPWFAFMAWPLPQGTILRDTLGQLEQCQRYYRLLLFGNFSNNDVFTVLSRLNSCDGLGSRFCDTPEFSQHPLNQNPELLPGVGYGSRISLVLMWFLPFFLGWAKFGKYGIYIV